MGIVSENKVIEEDKEKYERLMEKGFGEKIGDKLLLSPVEALYLLENKEIEIKGKRGKLGWKALLEKFEKYDKGLANKYIVFKDLRKKGYVVRTGLKYGAHFRVYRRGVRVGEGHSHWLVEVIPEEWKTSIYNLSRAIRLAHSVRKEMIWAVIDTEGDITYYKIERIKP